MAELERNIASIKQQGKLHAFSCRLTGKIFNQLSMMKYRRLRNVYNSRKNKCRPISMTCISSKILEHIIHNVTKYTTDIENSLKNLVCGRRQRQFIILQSRFSSVYFNIQQCYNNEMEILRTGNLKQESLQIDSFAIIKQGGGANLDWLHVYSYTQVLAD